MAKENYLECGKIVSTHGVRGTVRLECYCDSPKVLATLKTMWKKEKDGSCTDGGYERRRTHACLCGKLWLPAGGSRGFQRGSAGDYQYGALRAL